MGDSVAEGTVLEWRVGPGDTVAVDDPLVEISTDKVDAELPSPVAGTVKEILVDADATVSVGSILCRIAAGAGAPAAATNGPVQPAPSRPSAPSLRQPPETAAMPRRWRAGSRAPTASTSARFRAPARVGG